MDTNGSQRLLYFLEQANQISGETDLDALLQRALPFFIEISAARAGSLYLDERGDSPQNAVTLTLKALSPLRIDLLNKRLILGEGPLCEAMRANRPQYGRACAGYAPLDELDSRAYRTALSQPLRAGEKTIGVVQLFDYDEETRDLLRLFADRLASEINKAAQLSFQQKFVARLKALIEFIGMIGSSLDRDEILRMIIENARELLNTEASSLFLVDGSTGESVLKIASNVGNLPIEETRIPPGEGIIGAAIRTGEPVYASNPARDRRHYPVLDKSSGFVTHSILAVPLRARPVTLGQDLGATEERIIGAIEAINKSGNAFDAYDTDLMETLAGQAATVLKVAELYANANELYLDIIKALAAAIDAKDPYTVGHSQRVSNFAIEIAHTLGLGQDAIQQIRIGALLHDVGKIGIPDAILLKPDRLTAEEFAWIKKHPSVGENIMSQVHMLHTALPCISEHHEKLDGSGYPRGLLGQQISLMGRIVAVADVFDAVTSDRPYRPGLSVEEAFRIQRQGVGTHFDGDCVHALIDAYTSGKITVYRNPENDDLTA